MTTFGIIYEFPIKECGAYFGLPEGRLLWPFRHSFSWELPAPSPCSELAMRENTTPAALARLSGAGAGHWHPTHAAPAAGRRPRARPGGAASPAPGRTLQISEPLRAHQVDSLHVRPNPTGSEGDPGAEVSRGSLGVRRAACTFAKGAGGRFGGGDLREARGNAGTSTKPRASSGSPLGPPCDFETGAPDRSLETATPPPSSRGRQRSRHRASCGPGTLLAGCQEVGGSVGTWLTAG